MHIEMIKNKNTGDTRFVIDVPRSFLLEECEPYGSLELREMITQEQGISIITDAILMAMHLRIRH